MKKGQNEKNANAAPRRKTNNFCLFQTNLAVQKINIARIHDSLKCADTLYIVRAYFELGTRLRLFIGWESQQFEIKIYSSSLISVAIVIGVLRALIKFSWKSIELGRRFSILCAAESYKFSNSTDAVHKPCSLFLHRYT